MKSTEADMPTMMDISVTDVPAWALRPLTEYNVLPMISVKYHITREDAILTGMDKIATLVSTGDNSPGAVWETASDDFRKVFHDADVVISKGQGNLEGLLDVDHKSIYFLLVTKCDLIAQRIGTNKKEFVVKKG